LFSTAITAPSVLIGATPTEPDTLADCLVFYRKVESALLTDDSLAILTPTAPLYGLGELSKIFFGLGDNPSW
jgi:hypothetical protein